MPGAIRCLDDFLRARGLSYGPPQAAKKRSRAKPRRSEEKIPTKAEQLARIAEVRARLFPKTPPTVAKEAMPRVIYVGRNRFVIDPNAPRCAWPRPALQQVREGERVRFSSIMRATCHVFRIPKDALTGESRKKEVVYPRQIAMYLASKYSQASLPEIGRRFGGRDHTTALHAVRKIAEAVDAGHAKTIEDIATIRAMLFSPTEVVAAEEASA